MEVRLTAPGRPCIITRFAGCRRALRPERFGAFLLSESISQQAKTEGDTEVRIIPSKRIRSLPKYAFAAVDEKVAELKAAGLQPIDFGVGDPTTPTPKLVREACKAGVEKRKSAGYPSYIGAPEYRAAVAEWTKRRFGVALDPDTEIASTIGSKEAVFHFAEGMVDPGDVVIIPSPGYPPYTTGTRFAEGKCYYYGVTADNGFLPDLQSIPPSVRKRAKVMWINYPNSPTGALAPLSFLEEVVEFGRKHDIVIASDEAYSELYYTDERPHSLLEVTKEGVIVFQSLSKRSAMTCYRVGWAAGDPRIIDVFKRVKTNIDSGTATFVQDAAIAALSDERHVAKMRREYRQKRDILTQALAKAGLEDCTPDATIYLWQRVPKGMTSEEFVLKLMELNPPIVVTPGPALGHALKDKTNPGEGYVRFAFVPSLADTRAAADALAKMKL